MGKERSNPQEQADGVINDYLKEKLKDFERRIDELEDEGAVVTLAGVTELLEDTNDYVSFVAGNNTKIYDKYRYRLFLQIDDEGRYSFLVSQGAKSITEIDVDVRRKNG